MAFMKLQQYRETYFSEGSRPAINTIKKWIQSGNVYGKKIGSMYYVDPDIIPAKNDLVVKVMRKSGLSNRLFESKGKFFISSTNIK